MSSGSHRRSVRARTASNRSASVRGAGVRRAGVGRAVGESLVRSDDAIGTLEAEAAITIILRGRNSLRLGQEQCIWFRGHIERLNSHERTMTDEFDLIVLGTGAGGSTPANSCRAAG